MNERIAAFTTPDWVKNAIFYQIFPERFANGDPTNDPPNVQPWSTPPTPYNFMGGDLQGIITHLDYLQDLGVTALYLNPIFQATSNHKYNTYDYFKIDPHFGTLDTFHSLVRELHWRGMRLILDGVFNHCGRGFYQFHDVCENGRHSPYVDWFHVRRFPIHPYDGKKKANYKAWWGIRSLPKFNTDNSEVRKFLLSVARYWIEQGADGWRLDVPNEIADPDFWREFRQVVKGVNPEAYIVGEIWCNGSRWLQGDQFDAVTNYLLRDLCVAFFAEDKIDATQFSRKVIRLLRLYDPEVNYALFNLLGSHDTARFLTVAGDDVERVKLAFTFLMTYPGAPCIYYGDEIGMKGAKDPSNRACFPWDEGRWNKELQAHVKALIALRKKHTALRTGAYQTLLADGKANVYAFARRDEKETLLIALNNNPEAWSGVLSLKSLSQVSSFRFQVVFPPLGTRNPKLETDQRAGQFTLQLAPRSGVILQVV